MLHACTDQPVSVPDSVWHINVDCSEERDTTWSDKSDEKWWDQVDLSKLILASNQLVQLSEDIQMLPALVVLDVSVQVNTLSPFDDKPTCVALVKK